MLFFVAEKMSPKVQLISKIPPSYLDRKREWVEEWFDNIDGSTSSHDRNVKIKLL